MTKLKKVLLASAATVMTVALAIGGTMAYLTSEDSDVNVMTLGNVAIEQHEYERVINEDGTYPTITTGRGTGYKLQEFSQAKPLYPAVGDIDWDSTVVWLDQLENNTGNMQVFNFENAVDKFVTVENTGKSDAYVRTLVAFECGELSVEEWDNIINYSIHFTWTRELVGQVEIDGNRYVLVEFVYEGATSRHVGGILPAGDMTYNSLAQVYMSSKATNEDVEKIDGNKNGTYDILVSSQAVQVAGFENADEAFDTISADEETTKVSAASIALDTAFGDISADNHPWIEGGVAIPTIASSTEEFEDAVANGGTVMLSDNVSLGGKIQKDIHVNLTGNTIKGEGSQVNADMSMTNGTYSMESYSDYMDIRPADDSEYVFKNMNFVNTYRTETKKNKGTERVVDVIEFTPVTADINCKIVFENCIFDNCGVLLEGLSGTTSNVEVVFNNCTFNALTKDRVIEIKNYFNGTMVIENCTFNIEATGGNFAVLEVSNSSSNRMVVTANNNKVNANKAAVYTYDPEKGETAKDSVTIDYYGAKNVCFFDYRYLTGGYSTVNENGTTISGDVAIPSRR